MTSLKEQVSYISEREPIVDESEQVCYMVQGNDSLEINSDTYLDNCTSSSNDDNAMDADTLNEELSIFCENLLSKYKILKSKSFDLKKENELLFSKLNVVLKKKV